MIEIIDDCIPTQQQDELEKHLTGIYFPWYYCGSKQYGNDVPEPSPYEKVLEHYPNVDDTPQMIHLIYTEQGDFSDVFPKLSSLISAPKHTVDRIIRIKANLTWPSTTPNTLSIPHCDYHGDEKFLTAIYYVNDNDGDTVIFDKKFGEDTSNMKELQRISPKKGRMIIFDGHLLHSGTNPTINKPRIVINYNFTTWSNNEKN
jgi:hypothetical protein